MLRQCDALGCRLGAGIANAVDQHLSLYICDVHNKYTFELLSTNSTAIALPLPQPSSLAVTTVASDSCTTRDSDTHIHSHTLLQSDFVSSLRILTCHNNRLATNSDPIPISSSRSWNETYCLLGVSAYFPGEWVCQEQPLSPVLDRLHEMAEGVTTR